MNHSAIHFSRHFEHLNDKNVFAVNYENVVGAVGFVSVLFPTLLPLGLIKVDRETGKEIRDANGLCVRCGPGEPGEFVGLIQRNHPVRDFDGYAADSNATRSKIISDVWKKGDMCFRYWKVLLWSDFYNAQKFEKSNKNY